MARRALPRLARTTVVPTGLPSISFQTRDEELAALISVSRLHILAITFTDILVHHLYISQHASPS